MNKDKRELDYPVEVETQFLMRLPEDPAKQLREMLKTGDALRNRLTIQIDNDMRHGEVKLDQWTMHAKIVDLPTIVESLKTIDKKSFYKTADICQMMICKEEPDPQTIEEESPAKNKKKDPYKVDKKFLWPHGITPPTKNVRKRRFRKMLKKKCVEGPEIEKEVKRLLRADNEADSVTWEIIMEDDDQSLKEEKLKKFEKKHKNEHTQKHESAQCPVNPESTSRVVDIFGGAVSDSDLEEDITISGNRELEDSRMSAYGSSMYDDGSIQEFVDVAQKNNLPIEFSSLMFDDSPQGPSKSYECNSKAQSLSRVKSQGISSKDDVHCKTQDAKGNMTLKIEQARIELEELKQRRQQIQNEIAGMDNLALQQRFQDTLHTLNQDIMYKEMEYQGMITFQNSEDI